MVSGTVLFGGHLAVFGIAALVCSAVLPRARSIRHRATRQGFVGILVTCGLWSVGYLGYFLLPTDQLKIASYTIGIVFALGCVYAWLYFSLAYTGRAPHQAPYRRFAVGVFLGIVLLKVTNPLHQLYFTTRWVTEPFPHLALQHGVLYWIVLGLSYVVIGIAFFMLIEQFYHSGADAQPLMGLVTITALPIGFNILGVTGGSFLPIWYEPIGVAVFAVGTLFVYFREFETIQYAAEANTPAIFLDQDGTIRDYNTRAKRMFPELRGSVNQSLQTVVPEIATHLNGGDRIATIRRGDDKRHVRITTSPFFAGEVTTSQLVSIVDVTDTERYRQELERYRTAIQASGDPIYILNENGHVTFANKTFVEWTGYDENEIIGEHISLVLSEDDVRQGAEQIRSLLETEKERITFELELVTKDGSTIQCENHVALLPFETEFRGTVGVLRDISDRIEREQELERERDRLEEFASVVSHDLRNPLNVAKLRLTLAQEKADSDDLSKAMDALDRMEELIEDVLTLAREGRMVSEMESVELAELVTTCWENVATGDATVDTRLESAIQADISRLQQLVENLIRNAVEHGGEDVRVTIGELDDGFYIEDTGPGIPDNERDDVFEMGYSTEEGGTGFGLSIAKQVATAHGWEIRVTDGAEGGARFEITGVESHDV